MFDSFGKDFLFQEVLQQHDDLAMLNKTSLNTFRIITYICEDSVYVAPIALRIGRSGKQFDNIHAGGITIGVKSDGTLRKTAFSEYGEKYDKHPDSGIVFESVKIRNFSQLSEVAIKCHKRIPWLGILSWDLTIDSNNSIGLIEVNTVGQSAWFCQFTNGEPLFGENTAKMLEIASGKQSVSI